MVVEGQLISDGTAVWKVKKIGSEVPAGTMQMFAGNTIPAGWLLCDGSAVSRTDYAKLFSAIGTIYGAGDGSATFNLPNLIDRVVQGSTTAGMYKEAGLPDVDGQITGVGGGHAIYPTGSGAFSTIGKVGAQNFMINADNSSGAYTTVTLKASKSNSIYGASTTVQPNSFTVKYIIKY